MEGEITNFNTLLKLFIRQEKNGFESHIFCFSFHRKLGNSTLFFFQASPHWSPSQRGSARVKQLDGL